MNMLGSNFHCHILILSLILLNFSCWKSFKIWNSSCGFINTNKYKRFEINTFIINFRYYTFSNCWNRRCKYVVKIFFCLFLIKKYNLFQINYLNFLNLVVIQIVKWSMGIHVFIYQLLMVILSQYFCHS